jgi:hypothetical protein
LAEHKWFEDHRNIHQARRSGSPAPEAAAGQWRRGAGRAATRQPSSAAASAPPRRPPALLLPAPPLFFFFLDSSSGRAPVACASPPSAVTGPAPGRRHGSPAGRPPASPPPPAPPSPLSPSLLAVAGVNPPWAAAQHRERDWGGFKGGGC